MTHTLFSHLFSTPTFEKIFSDEGILLKMLLVEEVLAKSQAEIGMIPHGLDVEIAKITPADFDFSTLAREAAEGSNLNVPFVKALTQMIKPELTSFVHYGATSQDIIDTATVLSLKEAANYILTDLLKLMSIVALLAEKHKASVMPARTLLQQATPTTFGLKMAGFLDALMRHKMRLKSLEFTLQFGGAAGTLAGFGDKAHELVAVLAKNLDLAPALTPYHSHRDRILEIGTVLGSLTITLGKMAGDIALLMQTEVGEVFEGAKTGRGGSSAMPHKRNPALSTGIISCANQIGGLMTTLFQAGLGEHERAAGAWQSEWLALPQVIKLTGNALSRSLELYGGLEVNEAKMRKNLDITLGLIYSEKLKSALIPFLGRLEAHKVLETASKNAISQEMHLREVLPIEATSHLNTAVLNALFEPFNAAGEAVKLTDIVLKEYKNNP